MHFTFLETSDLYLFDAKLSNEELTYGPMHQAKGIRSVKSLFFYLSSEFRSLCWEATVTGGFETGPRFSFKNGHCNLKKSALFFISFGNTLLLCYCYIFVMKIKNGISLSWKIYKSKIFDTV